MRRTEGEVVEQREEELASGGGVQEDEPGLPSRRLPDARLQDR